VIVIDDGSGKDVVDQYEGIRQALDSRFIIAEPLTPGAAGTGPADARNRGLSRAAGKFIAFLDDDDEWVAPDHLEIGLNALTANDADLFFANMEGHRGGTVTTTDWFACAPDLQTGTRLIVSDRTVHEVDLDTALRALRRQVIHPNTMIVRADVVRRFGGFPKHAWAYEDYNFAFHVLDSARRALYRPDVVARYRYPQGDSTTTSHASMQHFVVQGLMCAQEVRISCKNASVRRSARALEGWLLRRLAELSMENSNGLGALGWAWQGFCTYPSAGAFLSLARALVGR
jgi:hypothetical protein